MQRARFILCLAIIAVLIVAIFGAGNRLSAGDDGLPEVKPEPEGHPKLESRLNQLVSASTQKKPSSLAQQGIEQTTERVQVVIESLPGQSDAIAKTASSLGAIVETGYRDLLQAQVPVQYLTTLADNVDVKYIRLPYMAVPLAVGEGVSLIKANTWHSNGYTGTGVKVAVLDLGFQGYTSLLGTELPSSVVTRSFTGDITGGGERHGTACAEIVYDVAPGASLYLVNISTDVDLGNAVDYLIAQGVNIISFSVGFPDGGPGNGTGPICDIVDRARNAGIMWVSAAGNSAESHWSGNFYNTDGDTWHEFAAGGVEANGFDAVTGEPIVIILKWNDTWGLSGNNYNLYLYNSNKTSILGKSENVQNGSGVPVERISYTAAYTGRYYIQIAKVGNPQIVNFHLYSQDQDLEYRVAAGSVSVPADSPNAMTVGAVYWGTPDTLELFSSQGPTVDGRIKPDIVAPDRVGGTVYGSSFPGTSAAAPHVAGAAALVKQFYPLYTPAQLQSFLEGRAVDLGSAGKDNLYGSGRLDLGNPLPLALPETLPESLITRLLAVWSTGYNSIADMASPKIRVSGTSEMQWLQTALSSYGISFTPVLVPAAEVYIAMLLGTIDAVLLTVHPYSSLENVISSGEMKLLPWSAQAVEAVMQAYPQAIMPARLPANTYSGQTQSVLGYAPVTLVWTYSAAADTFVASGLPTTNYNGFYIDVDSKRFYELRVGYDSQKGNQRALLKFNLSTIPGELVIGYAALKLRMRSYWSPTISIISSRVTSDWAESSVTWNTMPSAAESYGSASVGTVFDWYSWDITALVQKWVNGTYPNYGVMLKGPETGSADFKGFDSREYTGYSFYPYLELQLQVPTSITSVSPNQGLRGQTLDAVISGVNFTGTSSVNFGTDVTINHFTIDNAIQITANISIGGSAATGTRDVSVTTPRGVTTLAGAFTVIAPPVADFAANTTSGAAPLTVSFTDQSTGNITGWSWNFGDGGTSTEQNSSHQYTLAGTFSVSLTVNGPVGSSNKTRDSYITVTPGALNRVAVTPENAFVQTEAPQQFSAAGYDQFNNQIPGLTFNWSVVNEGGTIVSNGLFTAGANRGTFLSTVQAEASFLGSTKQGTASAIVGASMTVTVTLEGYGRPESGMNVPLTIKLYDQPVTTANIYDPDPLKMLNPLETFSTADGNIAITDKNTDTKVITFTVGALPTGTHNITLHSPHCLVNLKNGVDIAAQGTSIDMGSLKEGDSKDISEGSKAIDITDFVRFAAAYESQKPPLVGLNPSWNEKADFDRSDNVDINDFSLLYTNYYKSSPQLAP